MSPESLEPGAGFGIRGATAWHGLKILKLVSHAENGVVIWSYSNGPWRGPSSIPQGNIDRRRVSSRETQVVSPVPFGEHNTHNTAVSGNGWA